MELSITLLCEVPCLSFFLGKATSQLGTEGGLGRPDHLHALPTAQPPSRASSQSHNGVSGVAHILGRKGKAAAGTTDPRECGPQETRGEAAEVAASHPVTMEVAVSFLGTANVTYILLKRMLIQHSDEKGR